MKIAVIGGGITGLTAAYRLSKHHSVVVYEREMQVGGLAYGFRAKNWKWHLEGAYHHLFTNDAAIINLADGLGLHDKLIIRRPVTANYVPSSVIPGMTQDPFILKKRDSGPEAGMTNVFQLDSPVNLLRFPGLSPLDKLRTGALAAFCKLYPFWQTLEGVTAKDFFIRWGGNRAWKLIWEPLMTGKFGHYDSTIAASWLWARIHKRTPSLVYFEGGFQTFIDALVSAIGNQNGTIRTGVSVQPITVHTGPTTHTYSVNGEAYDRIILTTPTPIAYTLAPFIKNPAALTIPHLHAQVLILETKKPILNDIYWLSVTDRSFPFLAVVAHTNFMEKKQYGGNHITYIGNYLPADHPYLKLTRQQLLTVFMPHIKRLNPLLTSADIRQKSYMFIGPYAQPVHQIHYSRIAPPLTTTEPGIFLANMDSIYPWDRGTNYAVDLGIRAAACIDI